MLLQGFFFLRCCKRVDLLCWCSPLREEVDPALIEFSTAGVIGSQDQTCPGFAPDVELYTFKVFTDDQVCCGVCEISCASYDVQMSL